MLSPVIYILVSMVFTSAALSTIFLIAWRTHGRKPYALSWAIGFMAATLLWMVNLQADWFASPVLYWLVANALALVLVTLSLRGHCQRTHCRLLPGNLWPYAGAVYAVIVWTTIINPHVGWRTALLPSFACITLFLSALMIIRYRDKANAAEWAAALSMILFGISQGIAAGIGLLQGAGGDDPYRDFYLHYNFITLPAGYIATSMFVVLMLASDISERMKEIAIRDELTGLFNRRGFKEYGSLAFNHARRNGTALSIIMTDIDRFKYINDKYGHAAGDSALEHFSKLLGEARRSEDVIARVGGEEFALLLPGVELRDAMAIADQLCAKVGSTPMETTSVGLPMTSSFGVAAISAGDRTLDELVLRADRALYRSKRGGRNQVDLESSQLVLAADGTLRPLRS
ncbi:MAG: GGDEF domain-containing protein [Woeseiaceae bacterium]|nr:GGDEF domain-containing protein [Woeseiaceae bacterium]